MLELMPDIVRGTAEAEVIFFLLLKKYCATAGITPKARTHTIKRLITTLNRVLV